MHQGDVFGSEGVNEQGHQNEAGKEGKNDKAEFAGEGSSQAKNGAGVLGTYQDNDFIEVREGLVRKKLPLGYHLGELIAGNRKEQDEESKTEPREFIHKMHLND